MKLYLSFGEKRFLINKYIKKYHMDFEEAKAKVIILNEGLKVLVKRLMQKRNTPKQIRIRFDEEKEKIWREFE